MYLPPTKYYQTLSRAMAFFLHIHMKKSPLPIKTVTVDTFSVSVEKLKIPIFHCKFFTESGCFLPNRRQRSQIPSHWTASSNILNIWLLWLL